MKFQNNRVTFPPEHNLLGWTGNVFHAPLLLRFGCAMSFLQNILKAQSPAGGTSENPCDPEDSELIIAWCHYSEMMGSRKLSLTGQCWWLGVCLCTVTLCLVPPCFSCLLWAQQLFPITLSLPLCSKSPLVLGNGASSTIHPCSKTVSKIKSFLFKWSSSGILSQ